MVQLRASGGEETSFASGIFLWPWKACRAAAAFGPPLAPQRYCCSLLMSIIAGKAKPSTEPFNSRNNSEYRASSGQSSHRGELGNIAARSKRSELSGKAKRMTVDEFDGLHGKPHKSVEILAETSIVPSPGVWSASSSSANRRRDGGRSRPRDGRMEDDQVNSKLAAAAARKEEVWRGHRRRA